MKQWQLLNIMSIVFVAPHMTPRWAILMGVVALVGAAVLYWKER